MEVFYERMSTGAELPSNMQEVLSKFLGFLLTMNLAAAKASQQIYFDAELDKAMERFNSKSLEVLEIKEKNPDSVVPKIFLVAHSLANLCKIVFESATRDEETVIYVRDTFKNAAVSVETLIKDISRREVKFDDISKEIVINTATGVRDFANQICNMVSYAFQNEMDISCQLRVVSSFKSMYLLLNQLFEKPDSMEPEQSEEEIELLKQLLQEEIVQKAEKKRKGKK